MASTFTIRTGDTVKVLSGIDRGKSGKVTQVLPKERRVVVEGVNARKKNVRVQRSNRQAGQKGEIITYNAPVPVANVLLVCPHCGKTTRASYRVDGDTKSRICKKCSQVIEQKKS